MCSIHTSDGQAGSCTPTPTPAPLTRVDPARCYRQELQQREDIVLKKEAMLAERSELEIKKLRSSQILNKDMVQLSSKLQTVEHRIGEKTSELEAVTSRDDKARVRDELHKLTQGREKLRKQRSVLDGKLQEGALLSPQEERR